VSIKLTKVRDAIYNNPNLIPILLRDTSIPKGMIYRELKKAVPCRIGIEFELSGNFTGEFCKKYNTFKSSNDNLTKFYNVKEIHCDRPPYEELCVNDDCEDISVDSEVVVSDKINYDKITEIRISISDFHQLKGLYRFMQDLSEFCRLHEGGGIHIHVDMSEFFKRENDKMTEVSKYIERRLNEVIAIFPKYTGHFNKRKVGIRRKATYLNISRLNTLEFRIAPLTFDYSTLMRWIRDCVKFKKKVVSTCRLVALDKKKREEDTKVSWSEDQDTSDTPNHTWYITNRASTSTGLSELVYSDGTHSYALNGDLTWR